MTVAQRRRPRPVPGDGPRGMPRGDLYGYRPGEAEAIIRSQDGRCLICGEVPNQWAVDHDHALALLHGHARGGCRKCVRGLICQPCNSMLGFARDNPDILEAGANYIRVSRERKRA